MKGLSHLLLLIVAVLHCANGAPYNSARDADYDAHDYELAMLSRLLQASALDNLLHDGAQKRGLDLGLGRGFSSSQAAKHLLGLSAASFAGGPGKRKRAVGDYGDTPLHSGQQLRTEQQLQDLKRAFRRR